MFYALHTVHVHAHGKIYTRPTKNSKDYFSTLRKFKRFCLQVFVRILIVSQLHSRSVELLFYAIYDMIRCGAIEHVQFPTIFHPFYFKAFSPSRFVFVLNPIRLLRYIDSSILYACKCMSELILCHSMCYSMSHFLECFCICLCVCNIIRIGLMRLPQRKPFRIIDICSDEPD